MTLGGSKRTGRKSGRTDGHPWGTLARRDPHLGPREGGVRGMDIGRPKRIIEIEPASMPVPEPLELPVAPSPVPAPHPQEQPQP